MRAAAGLPVVADLGAGYETFEDLAAAIGATDLVVSVDTACAHLARAIGKPCPVLLSKMSDWHWLLDRPDSPWYPTVRLFRQRDLGDWEPVLRSFKGELAALCRPGAL